MKNETCTWAINNFPRSLRNRYAAWLRSNDVTIRDHLEYLIAKTLRENNVDIPKFQLDELVRRIQNKAKELR